MIWATEALRKSQSESYFDSDPLCLRAALVLLKFFVSESTFLFAVKLALVIVLDLGAISAIYDNVQILLSFRPYIDNRLKFSDMHKTKISMRKTKKRNSKLYRDQWLSTVTTYCHNHRVLWRGIVCELTYNDESTASKPQRDQFSSVQ